MSFRWNEYPMARSVADACLASVFGGQRGQPYGELTQRQAELLISDLIELADNEGFGDMYQATEELARRLRPASLASYVATLKARRP